MENDQTRGEERPYFAIHDRIRACIGRDKIADIARGTGLNSETIRRHIRGTPPSVQFVAELCLLYGVRTDWLILGRGEMTQELECAKEVSAFSNSMLIVELANRLLTDMDSLSVMIELFAQAEQKSGGEQAGVNLGQEKPADSVSNDAVKRVLLE